MEFVGHFKIKGAEDKVPVYRPVVRQGTLARSQTMSRPGPSAKTTAVVAAGRSNRALQPWFLWRTVLRELFPLGTLEMGPLLDEEDLELLYPLSQARPPARGQSPGSPWALKPALQLDPTPAAAAAAAVAQGGSFRARRSAYTRPSAQQPPAQPSAVGRESPAGAAPQIPEPGPGAGPASPRLSPLPPNRRRSIAWVPAESLAAAAAGDFIPPHLPNPHSPAPESPLPGPESPRRLAVPAGRYARRRSSAGSQAGPTPPEDLSAYQAPSPSLAIGPGAGERDRRRSLAAGARGQRKHSAAASDLEGGSGGGSGGENSEQEAVPLGRLLAVPWAAPPPPSTMAEGADPSGPDSMPAPHMSHEGSVALPLPLKAREAPRRESNGSGGPAPAPGPAGGGDGALLPGIVLPMPASDSSEPHHGFASLGSFPPVEPHSPLPPHPPPPPPPPPLRAGNEGAKEGEQPRAPPARVQHRTMSVDSVASSSHGEHGGLSGSGGPFGGLSGLSGLRAPVPNEPRRESNASRAEAPLTTTRGPQRRVSQIGGVLSVDPPAKYLARALRALVAKLVTRRAAAAGPILLVFEDAHHADSQSWAAIGSLLAALAGAPAARARLAVLVTIRPLASASLAARLAQRLLEAGPTAVQHVVLGPLSEGDVESLCLAALGAQRLPRAVQAFISAQDGARSALVGSLDRLTPSQAMTLKLASVAGVHFSAAEVLACHPGTGAGAGAGAGAERPLAESGSALPAPSARKRGTGLAVAATVAAAGTLEFELDELQAATGLAAALARDLAALVDLHMLNGIRKLAEVAAGPAGGEGLELVARPDDEAGPGGDLEGGKEGGEGEGAAEASTEYEFVQPMLQVLAYHYELAGERGHACLFLERAPKASLVRWLRCHGEVLARMECAPPRPPVH
eukprot:tig00020693_g13036.t1